MFTIEVKDTGVNDALKVLIGKVGNMQPVLQAIGEDIMERAKQRFASSTGPDGQRWKPNARSTIEAYLEHKSGSYASFSNVSGVYKNGLFSDIKSRQVTRKMGRSRVGDKKGYYLKDGTLSTKSQNLLMSKKPLIGESRSLSNQFHVKADGNSVTIGNSMIYAAIQQFGGQAGRGKKVTIPARPFLPIRENGFLYADEQAKIMQTLNRYLAGV